MHREGVQVLDETERKQKFVLKRSGNFTIGFMWVLHGKLQSQVAIQAEMVKIGKMPHPSESSQVLKADEHTEAPSLFRKWSRWSIDENPEMEIIKSFRFLARRHAWNFTFAADMVDGFWPWSGDLDENIVLKDFLGFSMDLMIYEKYVQMILVTSRFIGIERWALGICGRQNLTIDMFTYLCRQLKEASSHCRLHEAHTIDAQQ